MTAHDLDGMLAFCAEGALGRYAPMAETVSCRFGVALTLLACLSTSVTGFSSEVIEIILARRIQS